MADDEAKHPFGDLIELMQKEIERQGIRVTDRPNWNEYFMAVAEIVALRSTCYNRKVGSVIVRDKRIITTGYNGAAADITSCFQLGRCERKDRLAQQVSYEGVAEQYTDPKVQDALKEVARYRSQRFCRATHSEANALTQASKLGISVQGADLYVTLDPCENCTKLIIANGINKVFVGRPYQDSEKFDQELDRDMTLAKLQSNTSFEYITTSKRTRLLVAYELLANNISRNRSHDAR